MLGNSFGIRDEQLPRIITAPPKNTTTNGVEPEAIDVLLSKQRRVIPNLKDCFFGEKNNNDIRANTIPEKVSSSSASSSLERRNSPIYVSKVLYDYIHTKRNQIHMMYTFVESIVHNLCDVSIESLNEREKLLYHFIYKVPVEKIVPEMETILNDPKLRSETTWDRKTIIGKRVYDLFQSFYDISRPDISSKSNQDDTVEWVFVSTMLDRFQCKEHDEYHSEVTIDMMETTTESEKNSDITTTTTTTDTAIATDTTASSKIGTIVEVEPITFGENGMLTREEEKTWRRVEIEKLKKEPPSQLSRFAYLGVVPNFVERIEVTRREITHIAGFISINDLKLRDILKHEILRIRLSELLTTRYKAELFENSKTQLFYTQQNKKHEKCLLEYCFPHIIGYYQVVNGANTFRNWKYDDREYQQAKYKLSLSK